MSWAWIPYEQGKAIEVICREHRTDTGCHDEECPTCPIRETCHMELPDGETQEATIKRGKIFETAMAAAAAKLKEHPESDSRGPAEFALGDIIQIGADDEVPEYRVLETKKYVPDENGFFLTMYGFSAYWDRELKHLKFTNTACLPYDKGIKVIGHITPEGERSEKRLDPS